MEETYQVGKYRCPGVTIFRLFDGDYQQPRIADNNNNYRDKDKQDVASNFIICRQ